jgi:hypothetical protein
MVVIPYADLAFKVTTLSIPICWDREQILFNSVSTLLRTLTYLELWCWALSVCLPWALKWSGKAWLLTPATHWPMNLHSFLYPLLCIQPLYPVSTLLELSQCESALCLLLPWLIVQKPNNILCIRSQF